MLTAVKARDPSVIFWGVNYTADIAETTPFGHIDPGDTWGGSARLALGLTPETSIDFATDLRVVDRSQIGGTDITRDAPDMQIVLAFPYRVR